MDKILRTLSNKLDWQKSGYDMHHRKRLKIGGEIGGKGLLFFDIFVETTSGGEKEETQDWHVFLILNVNWI